MLDIERDMDVLEQMLKRGRLPMESVRSDRERGREPV